MQITEVRIKLMEDSSERLQAFCSITFDDCFVVRDLKIIEGASGPFVAMPSRKLTSHCPGCGCKNHLRAPYCNQCGGRLKDDRAIKDSDGRAKLYADIAHPINSACREMIQNRVIEEFQIEQDRAKQPGYVSRYDDFDIDIDDTPARSSKQSSKDSESTTRPEKTHIEQAHPPRAPHTPAGTPEPTDSESSKTQPSDSSGLPPTPHTKPHTPDSSLPRPHTDSTRKRSDSEESDSSSSGNPGGESSSAGSSLPPGGSSQKPDNSGSEFGAGIF